MDESAEFAAGFEAGYAATLRWWRHAVALLRHRRGEDTEAFEQLLADPDVDLQQVVARLCDLVALALVAADIDTDTFVDGFSRELLVGAADPAVFRARWHAEGEGG